MARPPIHQVRLVLLPFDLALVDGVVPLEVPCVLHMRFSARVDDLRLHGSPCLGWFVARQRPGHQPHAQVVHDLEWRPCARGVVSHEVNVLGERFAPAVDHAPDGVLVPDERRRIVRARYGVGVVLCRSQGAGQNEFVL
jgi:hypothetical protein